MCAVEQLLANVDESSESNRCTGSPKDQSSSEVAPAADSMSCSG